MMAEYYKEEGERQLPLSSRNTKYESLPLTGQQAGQTVENMSISQQYHSANHPSLRTKMSFSCILTSR